MLSKQITYLRKKSKMSQSQLAERLNISPSTVGMYEQGRRFPDLPTLISISRLFNVTLDYLITGEESAQYSPAELQFLLRRDILAKKQQGATMLITDLKTIGNRLREIRKDRKLSQSTVAAAANISERAYADIERGETNMRVETMLQICQALHITPDAVFAEESNPTTIQQKELLQRLNSYSVEDRERVYNLLSTILKML